MNTIAWVMLGSLLFAVIAGGIAGWLSETKGQTRNSNFAAIVAIGLFVVFVLAGILLALGVLGVRISVGG